MITLPLVLVLVMVHWAGVNIPPFWVFFPLIAEAVLYLIGMLFITCVFIAAIIGENKSHK